MRSTLINILSIPYQMKNMYVFFLTNFKLAGESEIPSEHNSLLKYVAGNMRIKCEINKIVLKPSIK